MYALNVVDDHVHLLVELPVEMSSSKSLQLFKGYLSYRLLKKHPKLRDECIGHLWSKGGYAGKRPEELLEKVKGYILFSQDTNAVKISKERSN